MKVSWQMTGIRRDAYAHAHRIQVEEEKPPNQCGTYLHPEAFEGWAARKTGSAITRPREAMREARNRKAPINCRFVLRIYDMLTGVQILIV